MSPALRPTVRRRLRVRLTVASWLLSTLVVAGALAGSISLLHVEIDALIRARVHDRATALSASVSTEDGRVDVVGSEDLLLDAPGWVFDGGGTLVEGAGLHGATGAVVRRLGRSTATTSAVVGPLHLLATPLRQDGRVVAVAVAGVDVRPYEATLASATRDGALLGLLAVIGATGLAALVLWRGLGPIAGMTERAAEWSRHRSGSRFAMGPPRDEVTGLASVLDELLDRVEGALDAERRLTAEIAHELRSPLTLLIGEADLALMNPATVDAERARYTRIRDAAGAMARAITALLDDAVSDAEGPPDATVRRAVAAVVSTLDQRVGVVVTGPDEHVPVRAEHLERMLAPILDNAVAVAVRRVTVAVRPDGDSVRIRISDDGPGIDRSVAATLFDPGVSTKTEGTGLGLALAKRLVVEAGGELEVAALRPATFEVRLPRLLVPGARPGRRLAATRRRA